MADTSGVSSTPSGMTGAGGGNLLRITGMATGLDVDSMVKKMMTSEQTKLDKAKQDQQTFQWKQEAYQNIIKDIKDLQSSFFDSSSSDKNILSSINFSPFTVNGVGTSTVDTSIATFTPGVGVKTGNYSVGFRSDGQLASAAIKQGTNIVNNTSNGFIQTNWDGKNIGFNINGGTDQVITLGTNSSIDSTVKDINNKISVNSTLRGKVQAVVSGGNIQFQALGDTSVKISGATTDSSLVGTSGDLYNLKDKVINPSVSTKMSDLGLTSAATLAFTYNGISKSVTINPTDQIGDVINNISNTTSGAVTVNLSQLSGTLSLQTVNTGSSQNIQITTGVSVLGISADSTAISGKDAVVYITPPNGTSTRVVKPTNNFTIDGMNYSLSGIGDTKVSVGTDSQKVFDKVKSFIDKYNTVVDEIQMKLTEKKDYNYKPLSDAQKAAMNSSDSTAWETKAKVGILRNDDNLQNLLDGLRTAFTTAVNNTGLSFGSYGSNSIGLDTSTDYNKPAHIDIVDPVKLKSVISSNSDQILKMFTNVSTATDGSTKYDSSTTEYEEDGVFTRINNILQKNVGYTNTILNTAILTSYANKQYDYSTAGSSGKGTIPDQIYEQQLMIKKIQDEMSTKQEKYYQQFSQLETAMTQLNSQQASLTSMLGG